MHKQIFVPILFNTNVIHYKIHDKNILKHVYSDNYMK